MKHAYINGIILDGSKEMEPQQDKVILTDGENIEAIVEKAQIKDKDLTEYEITDLAGNYIMPGLINLHLHLPATGKPKKKQQDPVKLVKQAGAEHVRLQCQDTAFERGHDDPNRRRGAGL